MPQQRGVVALPNVDVGQQQMQQRVIGIALARFFCNFLGSLHPVQPHQGPRQLKLAVPGVAIQLQPSARQGFGFREPLVVREKRGQAEEGLRIAALAEVEGCSAS